MADEVEEVGATATRRSSLNDALKPDQVVDEFGEDVDVSEGALADKYGGDNEVGEVGPQKKWVKFSYEPSLKTMAEELTEALEDYGFKVFVEENYPLSHTSPWRGTHVCGVALRGTGISGLHSDYYGTVRARGIEGSAIIVALMTPEYQVCILTCVRRTVTTCVRCRKAWITRRSWPSRLMRRSRLSQ